MQTPDPKGYEKYVRIRLSCLSQTKMFTSGVAFTGIIFQQQFCLTTIDSIKGMDQQLHKIIDVITYPCHNLTNTMKAKDVLLF